MWMLLYFHMHTCDFLMFCTWICLIFGKNLGWKIWCEKFGDKNIGGPPHIRMEVGLRGRVKLKGWCPTLMPNDLVPSNLVQIHSVPSDLVRKYPTQTRLCDIFEEKKLASDYASELRLSGPYSFYSRSFLIKSALKVLVSQKKGTPWCWDIFLRARWFLAESAMNQLIASSIADYDSGSLQIRTYYSNFIKSEQIRISQRGKRYSLCIVCIYSETYITKQSAKIEFQNREGKNGR